MAESCSVGSWKAQHSWFLLFYPETNSPCFSSHLLWLSLFTPGSLSLSLSLSLSFNSYFSELCFVHMFCSPVEQNIAHRSLILLTHLTSVLLSLITYFFCISFTWFVCVCACFHFNPFNNNSNIKKLVQKSLCSFYVKKKRRKKEG